MFFHEKRRQIDELVDILESCLLYVYARVYWTFAFFLFDICSRLVCVLSWRFHRRCTCVTFVTFLVKTAQHVRAGFDSCAQCTWVSFYSATGYTPRLLYLHLCTPCFNFNISCDFPLFVVILGQSLNSKQKYFEDIKKGYILTLKTLLDRLKVIYVLYYGN